MKKILVAVDGSPREHDVLEAAVDLAHRTGAELVLLRVVGIPYGMPQDLITLTPQDFGLELEKRAKVSLVEISEKFPADVKCTMRVVTGIAWGTVCSVAQEEDVDLIVIGSHGYAGIDRLIGTTAAKVVNHTDRSVLVVRKAERLK